MGYHMILCRCCCDEQSQVGVTHRLAFRYAAGCLLCASDEHFAVPPAIKIYDLNSVNRGLSPEKG